MKNHLGQWRAVLLIVMLSVGTLWAGTAEAQFVAQTQVYRLGNHDGNTGAPPAYGLRLDELVNVGAGHDMFTFDFEHPGSQMFAELNGSSLHIYGTAFGGIDGGSLYASKYAGFWGIDFTYGNLEPVLGDNDLIAIQAVSTGTIEQLFDNTSETFGNPAGTVFALTDYAGNMGYSFRWGDEDNDLGHMGFPGTSGWGWLNHGDGSHVVASDWKFTATEVPEPSTYLVLGSLMMLVFLVRRRQARTA